MKLNKVGIRDQMTPVRIAPRPARLVDKNCHPLTVEGRASFLRVRTADTLDGVSATVDTERTEIVEPDVISLTIPAAMRFVRLARIGAASIARRKGLSVRAIDDLRLAIDETFALLLRDSDHAGSVDVTFEVDDHELVVLVVQRLADGALEANAEDLVRFEIVIEDLVDRFEANPELGVVQFSKKL